MKIHLPNSAFLGNMDSFLRGLDLSEPDRLEITGNKKWISIHPVVLCMVAALGLRAGPSAIKCERIEARSGHYMERMGLFRLLGIESGFDINEHEPAGRFIPLSRVTDSGELTRFITEMVPLLHLRPGQADAIKYVVSELVRNVIEHSGSDEGAIVAAQYYPKGNSIKIGIVDNGVGIKKTINQSHPAQTHLEAIRLALTPGITGTTRREGGTEENFGAGLFFIKSIAYVKRNFFMVYSGNAMYKLLKRSAGSKRMRLNSDPFKDRHSSGERYPGWRGTVVGIDISLDDTTAFSVILDFLRDIYVRSVRERRKERFRKPRFV